MIKIRQIASDFDLEIIGDADLEIQSVCSLDNQSSNHLSWVKSDKYLDKLRKGAFLVNKELQIEENPELTYLVTLKSPKLIFSKIIKTYFTPPIEYYLENKVNEHRRNQKIKIGDNVFIGNDVKIGDGTVIFPNVVIEAKTEIGKNCLIKSHVSLGTDGLGIQLNPETDLLEKFPQIGITILEDNVEIGPNSTVRRGALDHTKIGRGGRIGSLVNIGHNCIIGKNSFLTCNIVLAGSSVLGDNVTMGVNSVLRNWATIGDNVEIGMGSVITKSIPSGVIAYGAPAKVIRKL
jgi:UDP-3-O-[3-hydroxymyristoyl] glucosamine N-acyltransferase